MTGIGKTNSGAMEPICAQVIERLQTLHSQYLRYMAGLTTAELDWSPGREMNSLCVLAVHVTEAERFWIGAAVDKPFTRDRPAEFSATGYQLSQLQLRFASSIDFCQTELASFTASQLEEVVDVSAFRHWPPQQFSRGWALLQAVAHTAEHLGHAGMTRQLLDRREFRRSRQKS